MWVTLRKTEVFKLPFWHLGTLTSKNARDPLHSFSKVNDVDTPKRVNNVEFITEVEKLITIRMSQGEANQVRFEVTKALQPFKPSDDNLTAEERRALRQLQER